MNESLSVERNLVMASKISLSNLKLLVLILLKSLLSADDGVDLLTGEERILISLINDNDGNGKTEKTRNEIS